MNKYEVQVRVEFTGKFFVQASNAVEANQIVKENGFVMRGEIGAGTENIFENEDSPGIYNWEWPCHADEKRIISIKKKS